MSQKRVLLTGLSVSHIVGSKIEVLRLMGYSPHMLDIGGYGEGEQFYQPDSFHTYRSALNGASTPLLSRMIRRLKEAGRSPGLLSEEKDEADLARRVLADVRPEIIWGIWGSSALRWLRILRRVGFTGKTVWTANVFPNRVTRPGLVKWSSEGSLYRNWLHRMDGLILTEGRMHRYMAREYCNTRPITKTCLPDFLPRSWFARTLGAPKHGVTHHVVYLGAPERYGGPMDRVDEDLLGLADSDVHVHCCQPKEASVAHDRICFYPRREDSSFTRGEFGQFLQQFDAVIVLYNLSGYHPRFASTFPTRFLTALCGCVP
ncbi:MAG: hypothetical protein KAU28_00390, partial [Phycisphaerae bacterium]|nr:hypothetical protein [Phycisphaerae bacterium]